MVTTWFTSAGAAFWSSWRKNNDDIIICWQHPNWNYIPSSSCFRYRFFPQRAKLYHNVQHILLILLFHPHVFAKKAYIFNPRVFARQKSVAIILVTNTWVDGQRLPQEVDGCQEVIRLPRFPPSLHLPPLRDEVEAHPTSFLLLGALVSTTVLQYTSQYSWYLRTQCQYSPHQRMCYTRHSGVVGGNLRNFAMSESNLTTVLLVGGDHLYGRARNPWKASLQYYIFLRTHILHRNLLATWQLMPT